MTITIKTPTAHVDLSPCPECCKVLPQRNICYGKTEDITKKTGYARKGLIMNIRESLYIYINKIKS
jgi:hypothetical protein